MTALSPTPWTRRRFLGSAAGAAAAAPILLGGCGLFGGDDDDGAGPEEHAYGEGPDQVGDLWLPEGAGPHPVVVLVHGGFWRAEFGRDLMDPLARDLVGRGWAAWNVEYRRVGQEGGGWPGTFDDVAAAVDHLAELDAPLDLDRVAVVGHSAGGHLAGWVAGRGNLPADAPGADPRVTPRAAVSQAGVLDLETAERTDLGEGAVVDLLGAALADEPERYRRASPIDLVPTGIPVLCVHGDDDGIVPRSQSQDYAAAAVAAGDPAELLPYVGNHFDVIDPGHGSWTDTRRWLDTTVRG